MMQSRSGDAGTVIPSRQFSLADLLRVAGRIRNKSCNLETYLHDMELWTAVYTYARLM